MALSKPGIDYTLNVSLEHMTLVQVVASLMNQYSSYFSSHQINNIIDKWPDAEEEIEKQALQLQLPNGLKGKVIGFIKPMFMEIFKWKERFLLYYKHDFEEENFNMLCWTPQGTIDGQKTVRGLIENWNLNICKSFGLACDYCLEEEIYKIWEQIPEKQKGSYSYFFMLLGDNHEYLTKFWFLNLKGRSDNFPKSFFDNVNLSTLMEYGLCKAISYYLPNIDAPRYFLHKLTVEERERILVVCAKDLVIRHGNPKSKYNVTWHGIGDGCSPSDVLCLLLSYMDREQQIEVLRTRGALMFFLYWPYQDFFMLTANYLWPHLHEEDYYKLLLDMCHKTLIGYKDYNYQNLFGLFWKQSPNSLKSYVRNDVKRVLLKLIVLNDKENIALILEDATIEEKETIIANCYTDSYIYEALITGNKWDILELLIKGCISSKNALIIFKEKCMERITCSNLKKKLDCFIENIEK